MQKHIIRTQQLDFYYSDQQALSGISLNIPENKICALIGPSGCGKSTFLRCINRMNELLPNTYTGGSVFLKEQNIYAENVDPVEVRKKVGMVFQKPNPFPKSIYENIAWGLRINGITHNLDDIVETNLKKAGLWNEVKDKLKKSALSLSGGQQQRLCIARAIAISPEVILMDEPTSALDPISTSVIENLIVELKKSYTIVIVTHNMHQAGRVSDITSFFLNGKIVEHGDTKELFYKPKDKRTEDYITGKFG